MAWTNSERLLGKEGLGRGGPEALEEASKGNWSSEESLKGREEGKISGRAASLASGKTDHAGVSMASREVYLYVTSCDIFCFDSEDSDSPLLPSLALILLKGPIPQYLALS